MVVRVFQVQNGFHINIYGNAGLAKFQAKEAVLIPPEIIDKVLSEIKKNRIERQDVEDSKVKAILKKLKLSKYYEHSVIITNIINGKPPQYMDADLEEKLRNMFRQTQAPFEKHKPKDRLNFLSYSYCLYKFCELLEEDKYLKCFPLLKSRQKLHQQDCIWKKICEELGWQYIPSL